MLRLDPLLKERERTAGVKWYQMMRVSEVTDDAIKDDPEVRRLHRQARTAFFVSFGAALLALLVTQVF